LLVELFGYKPTVKRTDKPFIATWSATEKARFIKVLTHDKRKKIDEAVFAIFKAIDNDDYLALGCMARLIHRGYDEQLQEYCERRIDKSQYEGDDLGKILAKLKENKEK
jgi:hypothetical protein